MSLIALYFTMPHQNLSNIFFLKVHLLSQVQVSLDLPNFSVFDFHQLCRVNNVGTSTY